MAFHQATHGVEFEADNAVAIDTVGGLVAADRRGIDDLLVEAGLHDQSPGFERKRSTHSSDVSYAKGLFQRDFIVFVSILKAPEFRIGQKC